MFLLHERTRKFCCRASFMLLCVVPTAAMLSWTNSRAGSTLSVQYQQQLSALLGLRATIADVVYPRPGITRFHQVQLFDPESRELIASADCVELRQGESYQFIVATRPIIHLEQMPVVWRALNEQLRRRVGQSVAPLRLVAGELSLESSQGTYKIIDVHARVETNDSLQGGALSFRPAGAAKSEEPVRVRVVRTYTENQFTNGFEIHTANSSVPCGLFSNANFDLRSLGPNCMFCGSVWATATAHYSQRGELPVSGWHGKVAGTVSGVDLRLAISDRFAHRLSGIAQIDLQSAQFRRGRLEHAEGTLTAGPGFISESLLSSAARSLGFQRKSEPNPQGDDLRYDLLALDFAIDESGLSLKGRCHDSQPGTVLAVQDRAMLIEPLGSSGPVVQILRTLIPDSAVLVPATRETESLMKFLPIPPVVRN